MLFFVFKFTQHIQCHHAGYPNEIRLHTVAQGVGCSTRSSSRRFGGMEGFRAALAEAAGDYVERKLTIPADDPVAAFARTGEACVETLPPWLGCGYGGTLTKGGRFGLGFLPKRMAERQLAPFVEAGAELARGGGFSRKYAAAFAGPELTTRPPSKAISGLAGTSAAW